MIRSKSENMHFQSNDLYQDYIDNEIDIGNVFYQYLIRLVHLVDIFESFHNDKSN